VVQVQAGGAATELARRCRSALLAVLVFGQGGGSNRLCVRHWLDAKPQTDIGIALSLQGVAISRAQLAARRRLHSPNCSTSQVK
jgi:hypothetical protein